MAVYPKEIDRGFDYDESGFTGTVHSLDKTDRGIKYRWRAVTIKNGKAVLAGPGERIKGFFLYFDSRKAVLRCQSAGTKCKNAGTSPLNTGRKVIAAERVVVAGQAAEKGFVTETPFVSDTPIDVSGGSYAIAEVAQSLLGIGYIHKGGGAHAADMDPPADVLVAHSLGD